MTHLPQPSTSVRGALDALVRTGVDWGWRTGPVPGARTPLPERERPATTRPAAVLVLLGESEGLGGGLGRAPAPAGLDVLLVQRAASLNHHPGQIAFPGGRLDPEDDGPVGAALREAVEETGLDPTGVDVVGTLGGLPLPVSNHVVTPVLAWWARPTPVGVVDAGESAAVFRIAVTDLLDPANRRLARVSRAGRSLDSPAFLVDDRLVWGFTGIVLDRVLDGLGWTRPWEPQVLDIPV
ncbi:NTP pyrophosphohydrolase [Sanguibacter keddieii DSM 10542]|uniref:NTP pyrophosphohydrolase n=1 Tax=Sanguibacter keddieii (strain ATCC 51767 / DSM 10542 / NCFB 3025 / ST-74) TaxID=446469 RepID=D1BGI8_SANKS|nr:CoA pyrophosphatase [Sanguibacter keddieii]ACZ21565.1 NTP pyrophosphohydrolase [Sanguibacter keddieii DSM 10542]